MKHATNLINAIIIWLVGFVPPALGASYTTLSTGLDKTATPYNIGINLNGIWYNFATITAGGVFNLPISSGGTGQATASAAFNALSPMTTAGDLIYGGTSGAGTRLPAGASTQFLMSGTTPSWITMSGDATLAGTGALTLATVNANVGSWGSATQAPQITVDAKGRITAATNVTVTPAIGSVTGLGAGVPQAAAIATNANGGFPTVSVSATAPATPSLFQPWLNTTATPYVWNIWDGASWVAIGTINATTHAIAFPTLNLAATPSGGFGGVSGVLPVANGGTGLSSLGVGVPALLGRNYSAPFALATNEGCIPIEAFGGAGDGVTTNNTALANAVAAFGAGDVCVQFGAGTYNFTGGVTLTPSTAANISFKGIGSGNTNLVWTTNTGGLIVNTGNQRAFNMSGVALKTSVVNSNSAVTVNSGDCNGSAIVSKIEDVVVSGTGSYPFTNKWGSGFVLNNLSDVDIRDYWSWDATGLSLAGTNHLCQQIAVNVSRSSFIGGADGILYGAYSQGLTVSQANFTNGILGINIPNTAAENSQLSVVASQFNTTSDGITINGPLIGANIVGNYILGANGAAGVRVNSASATDIVINDNFFLGSGSIGVVANTTAPTNSGTIIGNTVRDATVGFYLDTNSHGFTVNSNAFASNVTTKYVNNSVDNAINVYPANPIAGALPAAGNIGEDINATRTVAAPLSMVSGTPANVTSVSLTPGSWLCYGDVTTVPAGTTTTSLILGDISTTSGTFSTAPNGGAGVTDYAGYPAGNSARVPVGQTMIRTASPVTAYLVAQINFAVSTMSAAGYLGCLRQP